MTNIPSRIVREHPKNSPGGFIGDIPSRIVREQHEFQNPLFMRRYTFTYSEGTQKYLDDLTEKGDIP